MPRPSPKPSARQPDPTGASTLGVLRPPNPQGIFAQGNRKLGAKPNQRVWALRLVVCRLYGLHGRSDRQVQRHRPAEEALEFQVLVERYGSSILGIDYEREDGGIGTRSTTRRVNDERTAEPPAAKALIDRQAANQTGGKHAISRQAFGFVRRKVRERKAGSGEGVIGGDRSIGGACNEAIADPPPNVLRRQLMQIAV